MMMRRHRPIQQRESALHTHIWAALQTLLPSDCLAWSVENNNLGPIRGKNHVARGCIAGVPDLHILYRGRLLLIELKIPTGRLSPQQHEFLANARHCGAPTAVCRSLEDVVAFLKEQGVRLKGAL